MCPSLTDYNLNNDNNNNIFKSKRYKDFMNKSLSNAILSIRDERNTNKLINLMMPFSSFHICLIQKWEHYIQSR